MTPSSTEDKKAIYKQSCLHLQKALMHLAYSHEKSLKIELSEANLADDRILQTFEGLSYRFVRSTNIFVSRCLKTYILIREPGFRGSLLDFLNAAHKLNFISSAEEWATIRELRNSTVHDYLDPELVLYFKSVLLHTKTFLTLQNGLPDFEN